MILTIDNLDGNGAIERTQLAYTTDDRGIINVGYGGDFDEPVLYANAFLLVRERNNLSAIAVGDKCGAMGAGVVLVEKSRQDVYRDVGRCAAQEIDTVEYRNAQRENRKTCIRID